MDRILDSVKPHGTNNFYDFGGFRLDMQKRRLWRGGEVIPLTPKEFEVLFFLVRRAGEVVEKEELLDAIWKDVYVEETTLARNVSWLRQKLGAANGGAKIIETVPKRGYRFLPEVTRSENAPALRVEEKILQRVVIKETITFDESESIAASNEPNLTELNLPTPKLLNQKSEIQKPKWFWLSLVFAFVALAAIGFAAYQNFSRRSEPKVLVASRAAPFSGLAGVENYPAFSPDGKSIAFLRNFGGVSDALFVVNSDGSAPERQLTFEKTTIAGLTWTRDSEKIIFSERTTALASSLRQISVKSGASELIATGGTSTNPAVSADGKTLTFVDESYRTSIWQLENKLPARKLIESSRDDHSPNYSPDDARIAFVSNRTGNQEIWIADANGKNQRQLTDSAQLAGKSQSSTNASPNTLGSPRFSPDGNFVAYDAQINGNSDIFIFQPTAERPVV